MLRQAPKRLVRFSGNVCVAGVAVLTLSAAPALAASQAGATGAVYQPEQLPLGVGGSSAGPSFEGAAVGAPKDAAKRFAQIRRVQLEGAFPEFQAQTAALIAKIEGRRVSLADAYQFAGEVQRIYASAGYALVSVTLEPKTFAQGEIRLVVTDGFIESLDLSAVPERSRALVASRLNALIGRRHVRIAEIQRHILLLGELFGIAGSSSSRPGSQRGGTILVIAVAETPVTAIAAVSNILPKNYGSVLFSKGVNVNNAFGLGENIHADVSSSEDLDRVLDGTAKFEFFGIGGTLPIGVDGFDLAAAYSQVRSRPTPLPNTFIGAPGDEFVAGDVQRASLRANYPLLLTVDNVVRVQLGFDYVTNSLGVGPQAVLGGSGQPTFGLYRDQYEDIRLAGEWAVNFPWSWGGKAVSTVFYTHGLGGRTGEGIDVEPLSRPGASPDFNKLKAEVHVNQPLPEAFQLALIGRAQTGFGSPLMMTEQLSLDGVDAVSGFGAGELYVDRGAMGRAELQHPFNVTLGGAAGTLTPYLFGAGGGGVHEQPEVGESRNVRAVSYGGGVRANGNFTGWPFEETLNFELARIYSNTPYANDGYSATFSYVMKYSGNPFSNDLPGSQRPPERSGSILNGFYVGLNSGYSLDASRKISSTGVVTSNAADIFYGSSNAGASAANVSGAAATSGDSIIGGGQIGYNFRADRILLGIEADLQGAGQSQQSLLTRMGGSAPIS